MLQQGQAAGPIPLVDVRQRLREIRTNYGLTIRDLAKKNGLNINKLSIIENGKASPSVETLQQLSFAPEAPTTAFFEDNTPKNKIAHYRTNQRSSITFTHGVLEDLGV